MIVTDDADGADAIMVALIAWLKVHQLDLLANDERRRHGIAFEVDFNNHETVDISIKLDLTERDSERERGRAGWHHRPGQALARRRPVGRAAIRHGA